jgi:redox-sensitive bicupin YhaK (pirin superfamily)
MKNIRRIETVWTHRPTVEGAGVHLRRAFGFPHVPKLDPFLLLDDFRADDPAKFIAGFPWHPHRGIETITYMLEGTVEHGDSMGNKGVISPGDVQWMTAGSGIVHQEMPKGDAKGRMGGFQLWANLPASHKMMAPRYQEVKSATIPEVKADGGAKVRVICGKVVGATGPVRDIVTDPEYLDVSLPAGGSFHHSVPAGRTVFAYVVEGAGTFDPERSPFAHAAEGERYFDLQRECLCREGQVVLYGTKGDSVSICAEGGPLRFLLVSGKPLSEPVAWWGPIVMNTQEELEIAFEEYQNGTFLKAR